MHDLGTLRGDGGSYAYGINAAGQVVGYGSLRGWIWTDGQMHDLNSLLTPHSGCKIIEALAINDLGQIAAIGTTGPESVLGVPSHAVLLTPLSLSPPTAPQVPTALSVAPAPDQPLTELELTWTDNSNNESGFEIERRTEGDWQQVAMTPPNTIDIKRGIAHTFHTTGNHNICIP